MNYPLVLYDPYRPVLRAYCENCKKKAFAERARVTIRLDHANDVIWHEMAQHQDLLDKIETVKTRIRLLTRGEALTELQDEQKPLDELSDGERFLVKKAWRAVAARVHPDVQGGDATLFDFMHKAYEAGDLRTLTEYVLSSTKGLEAQIEYWLTEIKRPEHNWQILQQMDQFLVLRLKMSGNHQQAKDCARQILVHQLTNLELEEFNLMTKI